MSMTVVSFVSNVVSLSIVEEVGSSKQSFTMTDEDDDEFMEVIAVELVVESDGEGDGEEDVDEDEHEYDVVDE